MNKEKLLKKLKELKKDMNFMDNAEEIGYESAIEDIEKYAEDE